MHRFILLLSLGLAGCATIKTETPQNVNTPPQNTASKPNSEPPIDCSDPDSYQIVQVDDPKQAVNIVSSGKVVRSVDVPSDSDFANFALNSNKKLMGGAEIEVEWGSRYYYDLRFKFACRDNDLVLTNIAVETFDKGHPSKWAKRNVPVKPPVPIGRFKIADYAVKVSDFSPYRSR